MKMWPAVMTVISFYPKVHHINGSNLLLTKCDLPYIKNMMERAHLIIKTVLGLAYRYRPIWNISANMPYWLGATYQLISVKYYKIRLDIEIGYIGSGEIDMPTLDSAHSWCDC